MEAVELARTRCQENENGRKRKAEFQVPSSMLQVEGRAVEVGCAERAIFIRPERPTSGRERSRRLTPAVDSDRRMRVAPSETSDAGAEG